MSITEDVAVTEATYTEPEGIPPRGTLIVLAAPGETAPAYARFGKRLASDAYRVTIIDDDHVAKARELLSQDDLIAPIVLVGSDQAARVAVEIAAEHSATIAALVLSGITVPASRGHEVTVTDEIAARTACPNHQRILNETSRSSLFEVRPFFHVDDEALPSLEIPALALHGNADQISPLELALDEYRRLGVLEVQVVDGGLHDILNDVTHRSVAATIVLFLERLRLARGLQPLVWTERL